MNNTMVEKPFFVVTNMSELGLTKSQRKFIRVQKSFIRRQFSDTKKQEELISELYKRFNPIPEVKEVKEVKVEETKIEKPKAEKVVKPKKEVAAKKAESKKTKVKSKK